MGFFKKITNTIKKVAPTAIGFAIGGPVGAAVGYQMGAQRDASNAARRGQRGAMRAQEEYLGQFASEQQRLANLALKEKERLQQEESDIIRARRKKGRRSLLSQEREEMPAPGLRKTLG